MRWPMSSDKDVSVLVVTAMPFVALSVAFFWMSSVPDITVPELGFDWQDKLLHSVAYFVYGSCTVLLVVGWSQNERTVKTIAWAFTIAAIFAMLDEYHQSFVPGRDGSLADAFADFVGIGLSILFIPVARKIVE